MPIVRETKRAQYLVVDQRACDDGSLSWAAKGLLLYLLSRPNDWAVNVKHLARYGGCGRDKIYRLLNELIQSGYAQRIVARGKDGRMSDYDYVIYEVRQPVPVDNPLPVPSPLPEKPDTVLPEAVKPDTVNATLPITDVKKSLFLVPNTERELAHDWFPSEEALSLFRGQGIQREFVERVLPEFILYWRDRNPRAGHWNSRFARYILQQHKRITIPSSTSRGA